MTTKKIKVLYVDDEVINLEVFKINFRKKYEVFIAVDGQKGLEILENNPDIPVVVSDMRMPEMNGLEFITEAKKSYPNIEYFILTGYDITDEIQEAIDSELIKAYFRKPFNMGEIDIEIQRSIEID